MQEEAGRRGSRPEPLSEGEKRHFSKYGKVPLRKSVGSEGCSTLSCGDHASLTTENDAIQPRESQLQAERNSPSGSAIIHNGSFYNRDVGCPYRQVSTAEKRFLQPTKSSVQDPAIKEQRFKSVSEEDDSILFPFD